MIRECGDPLGKLLRSAGFRVSLHGSVSEFLAADRPEGPACLVLDVRLPGQSGLELQRELAGAQRQLPIIFITGHGDIPMSVQAMKGGAIEFLTKPYREQDLLEAIQLGHARDRARLEQERAMEELKVRFETFDATGARGHGVRGDRAVKQADRGRPRRKRNHGKSSSWPSDA